MILSVSALDGINTTYAGKYDVRVLTFVCFSMKMMAVISEY